MCAPLSLSVCGAPGPAIMVTGFTAVGISLTGTGAGYIHEAWLGEIPAGSEVNRATANATVRSLCVDRFFFLERASKYMVCMPIKRTLFCVSSLHLCV